MKEKVVPIELERRFIKLEEKRKPLLTEYEEVKSRLLTYHKKGYTFTLLSPSDTSNGAAQIPWKTVALILMKKFMSSVVRKAYIQMLTKKYTVERAPRFSIKKGKVRHAS